jgi:hypothetical protein
MELQLVAHQEAIVNINRSNNVKLQKTVLEANETIKTSFAKTMHEKEKIYLSNYAT